MTGFVKPEDTLRRSLRGNRVKPLRKAASAWLANSTPRDPGNRHCPPALQNYFSPVHVLIQKEARPRRRASSIETTSGEDGSLVLVGLFEHVTGHCD